MVLNAKKITKMDLKKENKERQIIIEKLEKIIDSLLLNSEKIPFSNEREIPLSKLDGIDYSGVEKIIIDKYRKAGWRINGIYEDAGYAEVHVGYRFTPRNKK